MCDRVSPSLCPVDPTKERKVSQKPRVTSSLQDNSTLSKWFYLWVYAAPVGLISDDNHSNKLLYMIESLCCTDDPLSPTFHIRLWFTPSLILSLAHLPGWCGHVYAVEVGWGNPFHFYAGKRTQLLIPNFEHAQISMDQLWWHHNLARYKAKGRCRKLCSCCIFICLNWTEDYVLLALIVCVSYTCMPLLTDCCVVLSTSS